MGRSLARKRARRSAGPQPAPVARPLTLPFLPIAILLIGGVLLLYAGYYRNPLLFDDRIINPPGLERYIHYWRSLEPRWLSYGTFGLNYLASGMDVFWYRVANVVLHGCVALALFAFIRRLLEAAGIAGRQPAVTALCASLLFAAHPLAVYGAGYLAQRSIVMATLFAVLALHAWLHGLAADDRRWLWASVALYFFAVWSKEHAVMLPAIAVFMTLALRAPDVALLRQLALPLAGFAAVGFLIVLRMKGFLGATYEPYAREVIDAGAGPGEQATPYAISAILQASMFFKYLLLWLLPYPGWMSADIRVAFPQSALDPKYVAGVLAFLAWGIGALALVLRRGRAGYIGFAMLVPWLFYLTEFAVTRVQEPFVLYRTYLWMIGLPIALAGLAPALGTIPLIAGTAALCIGLGAATRDRLDSFSAPYKFWDDVVRKNSDRTLKFVDRGLSNRSVSLMHQGRFAEALPDIEESIRINPKNAHTWINRAIIYSRQGDQQKALEYANEALRLDAAFGEAYAERCVIYMKLSRDAEALQDCSKALERSPDYPPALLNRGVLLGKQNRTREALADFDHILRFDRQNPIALFNRGMALQQLGEPEPARASLSEACRLGMGPACDALKR